MNCLRSVVVASHNGGKIRELAALLVPLGITVTRAGDHGLAEPEETGRSFAENAILKARAAADATGIAALADDSGLVVPALDGQPGIYSARWAGAERDFAAAMKRVEQELLARGAASPAAHFVCSLALAEPGGGVAVFEGEIAGHLEFPPRGARGFGYDPIFVAEGMLQTFGEIEPALKDSISHRARAFAKLRRHLGVGAG